MERFLRMDLEFFGEGKVEKGLVSELVFSKIAESHYYGSNGTERVEAATNHFLHWILWKNHYITGKSVRNRFLTFRRLLKVPTTSFLKFQPFKISLLSSPFNSHFPWIQKPKSFVHFSGLEKFLIPWQRWTCRIETCISQHPGLFFSTSHFSLHSLSFLNPDSEKWKT